MEKQLFADGTGHSQRLAPFPVVRVREVHGCGGDYPWVTVQGQLAGTRLFVGHICQKRVPAVAEAAKYVRGSREIDRPTICLHFHKDCGFTMKR